jgi:hypothetical protein
MSDIKTLQDRLRLALARLDESAPGIQSNRNAIAFLAGIFQDFLKLQEEKKG